MILIRSVFVAFTIWVLTALLNAPEYWRKFSKAYQRGALSKPIEGWPWFTLLHQPTQLLIKKLNQK